MFITKKINYHVHNYVHLPCMVNIFIIIAVDKLFWQNFTFTQSTPNKIRFWCWSWSSRRSRSLTFPVAHCLLKSY